MDCSGGVGCFVLVPLNAEVDTDTDADEEDDPKGDGQADDQSVVLPDAVGVAAVDAEVGPASLQAEDGLMHKDKRYQYLDTRNTT